METILVRINEPKFEYDVHALIRSFYPGTDVSFSEDAAPDAVRTFRITIGERTSVMETEGRSVALAGGTEDKNALKLSFYNALSALTGRTLPWGNLTGIRPTKIAMEGIENGLDDETICEKLEREHAVSGEKQKLCVDIAHREKALLDCLDYENGYSLYIGIPFCPTTCLYCSFTSFPIALWRKRVGDFIAALKEEIIATARLMEGRRLETVYMGGGTPTSLEADELREILDCLNEHFDMTHVREFTVEAGRPDSITKEKLDVLKACGADRISVNPQTMNDETLKLIGRNHTTAMLKESYELARKAGFDNINMDIILGLPGETEDMVRHTISEIERLGPDSLTVHSLAIKRASALNRMMKERSVDCLENTDELMRYAAEGALRMHMKPYYLYRQKNMSGNFENVGYAREGAYGIYNILIMEEKQSILALGPGSVSKVVTPDGRIERCDNVKDVKLYMDEIPELIERKRKLLLNLQ